MNAPASSKRLHFAWVAVMALVMTGMALFGSAYNATESSQAGTFAYTMVIVMGPFFAAGLGVWLLLAHGICRRQPAWRWRTHLALLPSVFLLIGTAVASLIQPPREQRLQRHFEALFHAPLPTGARGIDVTCPRLSDGGHVDFAFTCPKASVEKLVAAMSLEKAEGEPPHFTRLDCALKRQGWKDLTWFWKADKAGCGYLLITDPTMEHVVVARNPLFSKSEDELNRGGPQAAVSR